MMRKFITYSVFLVLGLSLINCSSGSNGGSSGGAPGLIIGDAATSYDFGTVVVDDSAAIQVKLTNNGTADLKISSIQLSDSVAFSYRVSCGSMPVTIAAQDSCTMTVTFVPTVAIDYETDVTVTSNAAGSPHSRTFTGAGEVLLSKVEVDLKSVVCDSGQLKAYVQVWDETGTAITNLDANAFSLVIDSGNPTTPNFATYLNDLTAVNAPISVAILMDHSGSVAGMPKWVADMEEMARGFVNNLGGADEVEIIKFDGMPHVVQPYTSDKALLIAAIEKDFVPFDGLTALYDAMYLALVDTSERDNSQRAIIVVTDGLDSDGEDILSIQTPAEVIALAKEEEIKIFTVSIGSRTNDPELRQFAQETGGQFFKVNDTFELSTVVNDKLLAIVQNAYEIPFGPNSSKALTVTATVFGMAPDSDSLSFSPCPP